MKIFLDIGSHNGQTIELAIKKYPDQDLYMGLEPVEYLADQTWAKIPPNYINKVVIRKIALDVNLSNGVFYEDMRRNKFGSSLMPDKVIGKKKKEIVVVVESVLFFFKRFDHNDEIILKIDVEGKEYDILECMVENGLFYNIKKIYVEWHYDRVKSITKDRHNSIVSELVKLGYDITGNNRHDEFYSGK